MSQSDSQEKCQKRSCQPRNQLEFCTQAVFAQELIPLLGSNGQFQPAVDNFGSRINGLLRLKFSRDFTKIRYKLYVFDATNSTNKVISAHLHFGAANVNGPVLVTLYDNPQGRNVDGLLAKDTIQNHEVVHFDGGGNPSNQINSIASIYAAIRAGNIYVNIHSVKLPQGAARGQIYFNTSNDNEH
ncbi:CHRD domain-containing protein [uncultured virus]|nr:CHRD domain-containing protein [uncultured virus]